MPTKLVRDKIPDRLRAEGLEPVVTVDRTHHPLFAKLHEEADELALTVDREATVEELADVYEVWRSLCYRFGVQQSEVTQRAAAKREEKGGFEEGYILHDGPEPRRAVYYDTAARDVARIRAMLLADGIDADPADIALAYHNLSESVIAMGWEELDIMLRRPHFVAEMIVRLDEVPR